jgi:hypothetical protein
MSAQSSPFSLYISSRDFLFDEGLDAYTYSLPRPIYLSKGGLAFLSTQAVNLTSTELLADLTWRVGLHQLILPTRSQIEPALTKNSARLSTSLVSSNIDGLPAFLITVPVQSVNKAALQVNYSIPHPCYYPINTSTLNTLHFFLVNDNSDTIRFIATASHWYMLLHFTPL